jgi:subfamily B ATP-binding cassette protein HlyB/CyaB
MSAHASLHCLVAVARHHGLAASTDALVEEFGLTGQVPNSAQLLAMARGLGLKARARHVSWSELSTLQGVFPLIARLKDGGACLIAGMPRDGEKATAAVIDPRAPGVRKLSESDFSEQWTGEILLLAPEKAAHQSEERFSIHWFLPEILRHSGAFRDIAVATFALGAVGLGLPIFTQLVIDKVLVHQNMSTLVVLTIGVVLSIVFETLFTYLRQYLLLAATRKIDMRLGRLSFSKLLALPLDYFEKRTAGLVTRQIQQVQTIRNFLTGSLFFTLLESVMFFIFLPVLIWYSPALTGVVFALAVLMALTILSLIGPFRRRLDTLATAESVRQGMLVENIHGMRTVKALAIEPAQRRKWEDRTAEVIDLTLGVMKISITAQAATQFLQRLMGVAIIAFGAWLVFERELTVGSLIAFQMLSGRVVGPLVQMVGLVHEYQQVVVSANMLGDIMNHPSEPRASGGLRPTISGAVTVESVVFTYPGASVPALDRVSLDIRAGEIVGIVGRSGSGKTTLARLLQSLNVAQQGVIRLDGVDLREIDLAWLRRNVGVVLQDNFMFRGTIRENISVARPSASMEEVVQAARAAGADEFIERLPQGFDTLLEENASNLSGGQRQRLAIARALLLRPKVLIFDEATSALDPESEAIVMQNLSRIASGRTVILISHRLSTLVRSDRIAFLEQGKLLAAEPHPILLANCEPYRKLWKQQMESV